MPAVTLCAIAIEQLVQWRYGAAGAVGLGLLTVGQKARNTTFICMGLVVFVLLLNP
jgi:hypothetical protein